MSIQNLGDLDPTDKNIILLITKGYTSSYSIWAFMKKEAKEIGHNKKVMTYKNVNTRVVKLSNVGLLEEVKQTGRSPHGRIDYKVTMTGLKELIPDILAHPGEVENIVNYMDKFGLDKEAFGHRLIDNVEFAFTTANEYLKHANLPEVGSIHYGKMKDMIIDIQQRMERINKKLGLDEREMIDITTDSSEVVKEIRQITNKYHNLESNLPRERGYMNPHTQDFLNELDEAIGKYRPEIAKEKVQSDMIKGYMSIDKFKDFLFELINKEYIRYNPKTKLYGITEKGVKYLKSNNLKSLEELITNKPSIKKKLA